MAEFRLEREDGRKSKPSASLKLPPVVAHLLQAEEFQRLLEAGEVGSRTELARRFRLTKARVTQLLDLLRLPEQVLDFVRCLPPGTPERKVTERKLRYLARLSPSSMLAGADHSIPGFHAHRARAAG